MSDGFKAVTGEPHPHFITTTIERWLPVFVEGSYIDIVLGSLEHVRRERGLLIHAYVIMPTHLHLIVSAQLGDLPDIVRDFKKFTSRELYAQMEQHGWNLHTWIFRKAAESEARARFKVWQDEYHPKVVYSEGFFAQKADYIHQNPVRKGLVADAVKWYHSSASEYAGGEVGSLKVDWIEWW